MAGATRAGNRRAALAGLWVATVSGTASSQGIFTCTDAQGRHLTSDRPIPACLDREQRELGPSGVLRRVVPPEPTAAERDAEQQRRAAEARARDQAREALQYDRALVQRYPNPAALEAARQAALRQSLDDQAYTRQRLAKLQDERRELDAALAAAGGDPARAPAGLRQDMDDNLAAQAVEQRKLGAQLEEQQRVDARFDAQLAHLRGLWAPR